MSTTAVDDQLIAHPDDVRPIISAWREGRTVQWFNPHSSEHGWVDQSKQIEPEVDLPHLQWRVKTGG